MRIPWMGRQTRHTPQEIVRKPGGHQTDPNAVHTQQDLAEKRTGVTDPNNKEIEELPPGRAISSTAAGGEDEAAIQETTSGKEENSSDSAVAIDFEGR